MEAYLFSGSRFCLDSTSSRPLPPSSRSRAASDRRRHGCADYNWAPDLDSRGSSPSLTTQAPHFSDQNRSRTAVGNQLRRWRWSSSSNFLCWSRLWALPVLPPDRNMRDPSLTSRTWWEPAASMSSPARRRPVWCRGQGGLCSHQWAAGGGCWRRRRRINRAQRTGSVEWARPRITSAPPSCQSRRTPPVAMASARTPSLTSSTAGVASTGANTEPSAAAAASALSSCPTVTTVGLVAADARTRSGASMASVGTGGGRRRTIQLLPLPLPPLLCPPNKLNRSCCCISRDKLCCCSGV